MLSVASASSSKASRCCIVFVGHRGERLISVGGQEGRAADPLRLTVLVRSTKLRTARQTNPKRRSSKKLFKINSHRRRFSLPLSLSPLSHSPSLPLLRLLTFPISLSHAPSLPSSIVPLFFFPTFSIFSPSLLSLFSTLPHFIFPCVLLFLSSSLPLSQSLLLPLSLTLSLSLLLLALYTRDKCTPAAVSTIVDGGDRLRGIDRLYETSNFTNS